MNYAKGLPKDDGGYPMYNYPTARLSLATLASDNASASSVLTFNDNTTQIEVGAGGTAAVMRWVATSDTQASVISAAGTANFDHYIPANTYRSFVVPTERQPIASIVGLNIQQGLYRRVAVKAVGVGSVLTTQY